MEIPQNFDAENVREVFAQFGAAIYHVQAMERELAILLATNFGPEPKILTRSGYDDLLTSLFRLTLGQLIKKLTDKGVDLPDGFSDRLDAVLKRRNWLAHNYFWERAAQFLSTRGQFQMIDELKESIKLFDNFDAELVAMTRQWAFKNGVTQEDFDKSLANLIEKEGV